MSKVKSMFECFLLPDLGSRPRRKGRVRREVSPRPAYPLSELHLSVLCQAAGTAGTPSDCRTWTAQGNDGKEVPGYKGKLLKDSYESCIEMPLQFYKYIIAHDITD